MFDVIILGTAELIRSVYSIHLPFQGLYLLILCIKF